MTLSKSEKSLSQIFILFILISILSIIILAGSALYFNNQLAKNKDNLLKISSIETARFTMSSALTNFVERQDKILSVTSPDQLLQIESRENVDKLFLKGLNSFFSIGYNAKDVLNTYKSLINEDNKIFVLTRKSLDNLNHLKIIAEELTKQINNVKEKLYSIAGKKALDEELLYNQLQNDNLNLEESKKIIKGITENKTRTIINTANKTASDLLTHSSIIQEIIQESDTDMLYDLYYNYANPQINSISLDIKELLNHLTSSLPISEASSLSEISNQLSSATEKLFTLRETYNQERLELKENADRMGTNLDNIKNEINKEYEIVDGQRKKLVKEIDILSFRNKLATYLVCLGSIAFITIMGYFFHREINHSLNFLIEGINQFVKKESRDPAYRLPQTEYLDLNQVISAFNKMAYELNHMHKNLQNLVNEKTKELSQANKGLAQLVNEHEKGQRAAEIANKSKSDFVANMSHELRTPLNAIIGYSELLLEDSIDEGNSQHVDDLNKIISSAKHLLILINDVLDLSKLEAGKIELYLEDINLYDFSEEIHALSSPLLITNNNKFEMILEPNLPLMYTDLIRVRQCVLNLISNACKFTEQGVITLTIRAQGPNILISVKDTGIGLSEEKLQKLFHAFTQADPSTTRRYGGTGLGLHLTKQFCEMLGGHITVESTSKKGSTFTLVLPIKTEKI